MDGVGTASSVVGLAAVVFRMAKSVRDNIKLALSERKEITDLIDENEEEIRLLQDLYHEHKELLDQNKLNKDLEQLHRKMIEFQELLLGLKGDTSDGKVPTIKEVWRAGDLKPKLEKLNRAISRIRNCWQDRMGARTLALLHDRTTQLLDRLDHQDRTQAKTALTVIETIRSEATEVLSVIQQTNIRRRASALSMHSQVAPAEFNRETTKVVADTMTTTVAFSILSTDTSLASDSIKLRLEEYKKLLESDSPTIEFTTEDGRTIVCRKRVDEMGEFLQKAQTLVRQMVDSRNAPTIAVAHRLRGLAVVLDKLSLTTECILVGNCALRLVRAIAPWSLDLQLEQAETLALIAGLSPYQPHARTLFLQAVTLCEEVVAKDSSPSNKRSLLRILDRAGYWSKEHPDLGVQWLGQAIQIMTTELPSTMVTDYARSRIYVIYGYRLGGLRRHSEAVDVAQKAVSLGRALSGKDAVMGKETLFGALNTLGNGLRGLRKYEDSAAALEEALELNRSFVPKDPKSIYEHTKALLDYRNTLICIGQVTKAAELDRRAIAHRRDLVEMDAKYSIDLCKALHLYGNDCHRLGQHSEAMLAYEESISLARSLTEGKSPRAQIYLTRSLHYMAKSLHIVGRTSEAEAAASEFLQRNDGNPF